MPTHRDPEPGSSLPPGFRRTGDATPVVEPRRLPAWLVGLIIAVVLFALVLVASRLLGLGDDPVVDEGLVLVGWLARGVGVPLPKAGGETSVGEHQQSGGMR